MKVLDRMPFSARASDVATPDGSAQVRPFQIAVWVSISARRMVELPPETHRLPAILDTGTNHNFTIRREQFDRWAKLILPQRGRVFLDNRMVPLLAAAVWIYPNRPRSRDLADQPPFKLELEEGIIVYPPGVPNPARLPILGLRGLVTNELRLLIDGKRRDVTLRTSGKP